MDELNKYVPRMKSTGSSARSAKEIVQENLSTADLPTNQATEHRVKLTNTAAYMGAGAAAWVSLHVADFVGRNPDIVVKWVLKAPERVSDAMFVVEHYEELKLLYDVGDMIGYDNLLGFALDGAGLASDVLLGGGAELALDVFGASADLVDGVASLGLGLALSAGVKYAADKINEDSEEELEYFKSLNLLSENVRRMLEFGMPPAKIREGLAGLPPHKWALA